MNQVEARRNLPVYADGELSPQRTAELEAELGKSPELRDELARWKELRGCAARIAAATVAPPHLADGIRHAIQRERVRRSVSPLRIFGGVTGIAALIVIGFVLWPKAASVAGPVPVTADDFAHTYRECAVKFRHRAVHVDRSDLDGARAQLVAESGGVVLVPDLRSRGLELDGVCRCFRVDAVQVLHVFYRGEGETPRVVSFFTVDRPVKLDNTCGRCACQSGRHSGYDIANAGDVVVYKWDEGANSFAVCSQMDARDLRDLVEEIQVASLQSVPLAFVRSD